MYNAKVNTELQTDICYSNSFAFSESACISSTVHELDATVMVTKN